MKARIKEIISSQVIDQLELIPGWREGMRIPLRLSRQDEALILSDSKRFTKNILEVIETESKFCPKPEVRLIIDENLSLCIKGCRWRFKKQGGEGGVTNDSDFISG